MQFEKRRKRQKTVVVPGRETGKTLNPEGGHRVSSVASSLNGPPLVASMFSISDRAPFSV
jgi:hypothetical protein